MPASVSDDRQIRQLAEWLATIRCARGMTMRDVGRRMGTGPSTVYQLESGRRRDPRLSTIQRYARAVGCRVTITIDGGQADDD